MSNFNTVTPTNESEEGDLYLLGRGTTSRTQKREILAAGLANARWSSEAVYLAGSNIVGSDGVNYQAVTDSGTGTSAGVVDPTTDSNAVHWKTLTGGATGSGGDKIFFMQGQHVTADFTIPSDQNAGSFGEVIVNDGVSVTIEDGASWTIVGG